MLCVPVGRGLCSSAVGREASVGNLGNLQLRLHEFLRRNFTKTLADTGFARSIRFLDGIVIGRSVDSPDSNHESAAQVL